MAKEQGAPADTQYRYASYLAACEAAHCYAPVSYDEFCKLLQSGPAGPADTGEPIDIWQNYSLDELFCDVIARLQSIPRDDQTREAGLWQGPFIPRVIDMVKVIQKRLAPAADADADWLRDWRHGLVKPGDDLQGSYTYLRTTREDDKRLELIESRLRQQPSGPATALVEAADAWCKLDNKTAWYNPEEQRLRRDAVLRFAESLAATRGAESNV